MGHIEYKQDFFDKADEICLFSDVSELEKTEEIARLKAEYLNHFPVKDSDYYYFLGYVGYMSKNLSEETEGQFREALRLNPLNDFCQYYFAYFLFDSERYGEALEAFQAIDLAKFEGLGITWRVFKVREAIAACSLFLREYTEADRIQKVDNFLADYVRHIMSPERLYGDPINEPREIIHSVSDALDYFSDAFKPVVARLAGLMEQDNLETAYRYEYDRFKAFLGPSYGLHS